MAGEDDAHLDLIRSLPCCVCGRRGGIEAHHTTHGHGHGMAVKAHDHASMPLCGGPAGCHASFHAKTWGPFAGWTRGRANDWQDEMVERYRPKKDEGIF